jgi:hypothetical protein
VVQEWKAFLSLPYIDPSSRSSPLPPFFVFFHASSSLYDGISSSSSSSSSIYAGVKIFNSLPLGRINLGNDWAQFDVALIRYLLAHCRTVPGSIPGGVTWDFFRGFFRQNHVP